MLFGQEKTMDTKILLVEDDTMLNEGIVYALRKKEYLVYSSDTIPLFVPWIHSFIG